MEEVLDIDAIIGGRGFVSSSNNDEEDAVHVQKTMAVLSSRLERIFDESGVVAPPSTFLDENSTSAAVAKGSSNPSPTIFSCAAFLYLLLNGQYVLKGRMGIAIIRRSASYVLIFYNANKEAVLCLPLGSGKISSISKQGKYCFVSSIQERFAFICLNDDEEVKLVALLMILCGVESATIDLGSGDEVRTGSSILYESTSFSFDGSLLKVSTKADSKIRLSTKSDASMQRLLGLRRLSKCLTRVNAESVELIYIKKVKNPTRKDGDAMAVTAPVAEEVAQERSGLITEENPVTTGDEVR
ncbi:unnamed protein product [Nippostrongylus brasiliensis]|uniref:MMS1_N domain-containing protein n=1 Tax=Nippostrongylus brasiliensis TaxID=27835 RepID=A0A0N4XZ24_NIPBR|nr:unnamed protein product [Nippostrongylus brasiliensis]